MARKRNGKHVTHRTIGTYKAYNFKDRDPAIDELRNIAEEHFGHRLTGRELRAIEDAGGPTTSCMRAWWIQGTTMRPTNPALEAAGRAIGFERVWRKVTK